MEFALLLPVFVTLTAGVMEMSWLFFQHGAARTAVSKGCRAGSMMDPGMDEGELLEVYQEAERSVRAHFERTGGMCNDCTVNIEAEGEVPRRMLRCTLEVPRVALTGWLPTGMGSVTGDVVMRMEHQRRTE